MSLTDGLHGPSIISWNLTRQCNLRCPHCYIDAVPAPEEKELSEEEALRVVEQLAGFSPGAMVVFSGGEPLLRRDLSGLVKHAADRGLMPVLGTNGTLLDETTIRELAACGLAGIGISLDSPDPLYHDVFRGKKGAWRKTMEAIQSCRHLRVPFQIHASLARENLAYLHDLVEFSFQLGAVAFNVFFLVCTGRGERLTDITPEEYDRALVTLAHLQGDYPAFKLRARCAPHFSRIIAEQGNPTAEMPAGCMAGNTYLRLSPEGKVTPCPYLPIVAGDLREQEFSRIWEHSTMLKELRRGKWHGRCGACSFSTRCRGCRARAYALSGDYLGEDPWCTYQPANGSGAYSSHPVHWQNEARLRIERVPGFIRERVIAYVEAYAGERGYPEVTIAVLEAAKNRHPASRPRGTSHLS
ncbi:MAG: radical SAM protein [Chloroflexi bacterium]|nr:radical SAM protein [Chloroflexota bacterium]